jgi:hypothetical protein
LISLTPENTLRAQYLLANCNPEEYKHPGIVGGFGSGKTEAIPLRWLRLIEYRAKQKIKANLMVVEPTYEMIRDILVPTLDLFFDRWNVKHTFHKSYYNYSISYRGYNFTAMLRSADKPSSLTGKNLTDILIDEYDKIKSVKDQKDVWNECISRVRQAPNGTVSPVTTPEGFKNTYELYGKEKKKNFLLIKARTYENFFLPKDFIENLYAQYSPELVKQYIEAEFINLTQGKVYYWFDRKINVKPVKIRGELPIRLTFDFNVNPMTTSIFQDVDGETCKALYGGEFQNRVICVWRAINIRNSNTDKQCLEIKKILKENDLTNHVIIYGDATNPRSTTSNVTNQEIIRTHFPGADFRFKSSNPAVQDRVNAVNSKGKNSRNEIGIIVNDTFCDDLIQDFEGVEWKEGKNEIDKSNSDRTHNTDNIGYPIEYEYPLTGKIMSKQW